jgi:hypothetical protein
MSASASLVHEQPELLTSWKEIAAYLGKGVRTVQRWELQYELPVRRPNEKAKGVVHATRQDLDHWPEAKWSHRPQEPQDAIRGGGGSTIYIDAVRASIERSVQLHEANRALLAGVRRSLENCFQQCQTLARNMNGTPPPATIRR